MHMTRHIVLLRGVNLVKRNRVSMPELRSVLEAAGYRDVATYVQSGNAVVSGGAAPDDVAAHVRAIVRESFGLDIAVLVRTHEEMVAVVRRNPLARVAGNPRRHLVTFLARPLSPRARAELGALVTPERFAIAGREIYSWHPDGIARTPLWERLASRSLGVEATSRNWTTVTTLLAMAGESGR